LRQKTGSDCDRLGPIRSLPISGKSCDAMTATVISSQNQTGPGSSVQPR
jgi:hypothetical protein